jgi:hypothetical protein
MTPNERLTPLTDESEQRMDDIPTKKALSYFVPADFARTLEQMLAERTEERDGAKLELEAACANWQSVIAERDALLAEKANPETTWDDTVEINGLKAKLAKCRDETYRAQTEALVLQAQLAGYLLSIAASDPRNETIFATIDKLLSALGVPPARQTLEETK